MKSSTYKIFKLEPDLDTANLDLTEVNPRAPIWSHTDGITDGTSCRKMPYTPPEVGMYSVLVEIADKANNTKYSRRLVLYDPNSEITISNSTDRKLYATSAVRETGYNWQSNTQDSNGHGPPLTISWKNHFENKVHTQRYLLNKVKPFPNLAYPDFFRTINVSNVLDDHEGKRTTAPVSNTLGIVKAEFVYKKDKNGGRTLPEFPTSGWVQVADFLTQSQSINVSRADGDTVRVWVRVTDCLENTVIDTTDVNIDSSPPKVGVKDLQRNIINGTFPFSSR